MDAALVLFAEFCSCRLEHRIRPLFCWRGRRRALPCRAALVSALRLPLFDGKGIVLHDLAFEDPDLHATRAVGRLRRGYTVIDISAKRVEWNFPFLIPFHARDLGSAEATAAIDADTERTQSHRGLLRALHHAPKRNAAFELLRDVLRDKLGIDLGFPDLHDV